MTSESKDVTEYIEETPEKRKAALTTLRKLCKEALPDYEESMAYKMPSYKRNGIVEVAFASQKNHICFYILIHDVMIANKDLLEGLNHGKGCIRYSNPDNINFEIVRKFLIETYNSGNTPC